MDVVVSLRKEGRKEGWSNERQCEEITHITNFVPGVTPSCGHFGRTCYRNQTPHTNVQYLILRYLCRQCPANQENTPTAIYLETTIGEVKGTRFVVKQPNT